MKLTDLIAREARAKADPRPSFIRPAAFRAAFDTPDHIEYLPPLNQPGVTFEQAASFATRLFAVRAPGETNHRVVSDDGTDVAYFPV